MGTFAQAFADNDIALIDAVGDDATLDIDGDGNNVVAVKGLFQLPVDQTHIGTIRRNVIEAEFKGRTADLSSAIKGTSQLTESGLTYDVVDIPPSVDGITVLVLRPAT